MTSSARKAHAKQWGEPRVGRASRLWACLLAFVNARNLTKRWLIFAHAVVRFRSCALKAGATPGLCTRAVQNAGVVSVNPPNRPFRARLPYRFASRDPA